MGASISSCRRGAVYVEFLAVIGPLLTLFLGLTQLALLYATNLLVGHAAARAARAAIVILPDDHEDADYAGVPLNQVGNGVEGVLGYATAPGGGRLEAIRDAARLTLAPLSPPLDSFGGDSVAEALGEVDGVDVLAGLFGWSRLAVAIGFPDGEGGFRTSFEPRGPVTVRVTYLARCAVPLGRKLLCGPWTGLGDEQRALLAQNGGALASMAVLGEWDVIAIEAQRTLPNQGR